MNSISLNSDTLGRSCVKDVVKIAWPALVELTLAQIASMVDMVMIGKLGSYAISAVGLTAQPKMVLMTIFIALNVGVTALVAQYKGAGKIEEAHRVLNQALVINLISSLIFSVLGYVFAEEMVVFMGGKNPAVIKGATEYMKIQMIGFTGLALTATVTAALRGVGNSKAAMVYNMVANIINVFLNWVLIYGNLGMPRMEIRGASLATVIGQTVAFVAATVYLCVNKSGINLRKTYGFRLQMAVVKKIISIGVPTMVEQVMMRVGIIVYSIMVANLGDDAYATHQIGMNLMALSFMSGQAFAVSATSLVGQSLGAGKKDMAKKYGWISLWAGMVIAFVIGIAFAFFGKPIVGMYSDEKNIIELGAKVLVLLAILQPMQSIQFILNGALRGAGDTVVSAVLSFITMVCLRPVLCFLFAYHFKLGLIGAWLAILSDQTVRSVVIYLRYVGDKWMSKFS